MVTVESSCKSFVRGGIAAVFLLEMEMQHVLHIASEFYCLDEQVGFEPAYLL
jgi:hypothetical protein